jgi:hypothetical protein
VEVDDLLLFFSCPSLSHLLSFVCSFCVFGAVAV